MISSPAPDARIVLDGFPPAQTPIIRQIEPGRHRVRVSAPGFLDSERQIMAVKGALVTVDIALVERPAKLLVRAPEGALLSIDGRVEGECPFPRPIELLPGNHLVTLTKRGFVGVAAEQVLVRGRSTVVHATVPRTARRTASLIMLGAAASTFAAGGVFAYIAHSQESTARLFLDQRGKAPLSGDDLAQYDATRLDRDRLRTAALFSAGSCIGLSLAGTLLFFLDGRVLEKAPLVHPRGTERDRSNSSLLMGRPVFGPGFAGFDLRGAF